MHMVAVLLAWVEWIIKKVNSQQSIVDHLTID